MDPRPTLIAAGRLDHDPRTFERRQPLDQHAQRALIALRPSGEHLSLPNGVFSRDRRTPCAIRPGGGTVFRRIVALRGLSIIGRQAVSNGPDPQNSRVFLTFGIFSSHRGCRQARPIHFSRRLFANPHYGRLTPKPSQVSSRNQPLIREHQMLRLGRSWILERGAQACSLSAIGLGSIQSTQLAVSRRHFVPNSTDASIVIIATRLDFCK